MSFLKTLPKYSPTRRCAWAVLAIAPLWLFSGTNVGLSIAASISLLLMAVTIIDALLIPSTNQLDVRRTIPAIVTLQQSSVGEYQIENRWLRSITVQLYHATDTSLESHIPSTWYRISSQQHQHIPVTITGLARGSHELTYATVAIRSFLGFSVKYSKYYLSDTILVIPPTAGVRRFRLLAIQQRMRIAGNRTLRSRGSGTSFANLREYAPGDDPRHIDWKATARRRHLISREFTVEQGQIVFIAIDAGRMMTQLSGDLARIEYAVSSALILADVALTAGDRVGLMVFNEEVKHYIDPAKGIHTLVNIRDALVRTTATMAEPDYATAFRTLATRNKRRSLIVLFSDVIDQQSSKVIVANTIYSAKRHLPLFVALQNDQLMQAAIPQPVSSELSAFQNAAAEELLSSRSDALQHMRQTGVNVLDTPPHAMTAALINRYLEIKARGIL